MKLQRFLSIPVFSVFLLMGLIYYSTLFIIIQNWIGLRSSAGTLNAVIFTFMASLCLFSFFACVLTDPGHVPASYVPDVEGNNQSDQQSQSNASYYLKQCDKCCMYKPPRAHHCRICRRCVLRMDHHCLWINNCVGYWNYKAFFILVLYATVASIYCTVLIITSVFQQEWDFVGRMPLKIFYIVFGVKMAALGATLGTLLGWHMYLIAHNMTTIEYYEGIRAAWLARQSGQNYRHPFDISVYGNITLVSLYLSHYITHFSSVASSNLNMQSLYAFTLLKY
ncbi:probable protein S-acyltransferase 15 isoform X3 [Euphorbia lathyris]|uniref:probable protein S-acyltransferase 15 isoform X3 n=1 Tax=Euphorbia lathyris TaxID=212925 RepID=UPI0033144E2E